jgi:hypothetical protein
MQVFAINNRRSDRESESGTKTIGFSEEIMFPFSWSLCNAQAAHHRAAELEQQVSVERSVNRDLMQRKSEMEYQLMEALARLPAGSATPPLQALTGDRPVPVRAGVLKDHLQVSGATSLLTKNWVSLKHGARFG